MNWVMWIEDGSHELTRCSLLDAAYDHRMKVLHIQICVFEYEMLNWTKLNWKKSSFPIRKILFHEDIVQSSPKQSVLWNAEWGLPKSFQTWSLFYESLVSLGMPTSRFNERPLIPQTMATRMKLTLCQWTPVNELDNVDHRMANPSSFHRISEIEKLIRSCAVSTLDRQTSNRVFPSDLIGILHSSTFNAVRCSQPSFEHPSLWSTPNKLTFVSRK